MSQRFPFSLLPPSLGDELLAQSRSAKLTFQRWPGEPTTCHFRLDGKLACDANQAAFAAALARAFSTPLPSAELPDEEGGAA